MALQPCLKLQEIACGGTYIEDLFPLNRLLDLRLVNFSGTGVRSLESLYGLPRLGLIICSNTEVPEQQIKNMKRFSRNCSINPDYEKFWKEHEESIEHLDIRERIEKYQREEFEQLRKELLKS